MGIFNEKKYVGVEDVGTDSEKANLYSADELVMRPAGVSLVDTEPTKWKKWPKRQQVNQSSCVYHSRAKMAGILAEMQNAEFIEFTAAGYNKRSNAPAPGSSPIEALDRMRAEGIGIEALEISNDVASDDDLKKIQTSEFDKRVAALSLLDAYYSIKLKDFDAMVSTLFATQKPIMVGFFSTQDEWNREVPVVKHQFLTPQEATVRHEVCATPNIGIYGDLEGFTIEDSYGTGDIEDTGVRFITRDFFAKRNYIQGLVPTKFKTYDDLNISVVKPVVKLKRDLQRGDIGDDVFALQQALKYEGLFPANHSGSTFFGPITERAVQQYQRKKGIVLSGTPETTGYGRVGPTTRSFINSQFKKI